MKKENIKKPSFLFIGRNSAEGIFSKKNKKLLSDPLDDNNPITVQVLGICSALAITVQLKPAVVMTASVILITKDAVKQIDKTWGSKASNKKIVKGKV